jgi:hypothetical protein
MTPQQLLDHEMSVFELGRAVHAEQGDYAFAPTGEPYITFCCGGPKAEGERSTVLCTTGIAAVRYWMAELEKYAAGRKGVLYWRERPLVEFAKVKYSAVPENEFTIWSVYGRLLISELPCIQSAKHDKNPKYDARAGAAA